MPTDQEIIEDLKSRTTSGTLMWPETQEQIEGLGRRLGNNAPGLAENKY